MAELYSIQKDLEKAVYLLENAKTSKYAKFRTGSETPGEIFIDLNVLNKELELYKHQLHIFTKYQYTQKQLREFVSTELATQGININFTQPKLKKICEYFNLKENSTYFYKYPESETYRCSKELAKLLINSFKENTELLEYFKL